MMYPTRFRPAKRGDVPTPSAQTEQVCAYCGHAEGHSSRCSVTKFGAHPYRMVASSDGIDSSPVDLGEMHRAVDLLASPSGEHVEHAVRELREGLRIALGEPEVYR